MSLISFSLKILQYTFIFEIELPTENIRNENRNKLRENTDPYNYVEFTLFMSRHFSVILLLPLFLFADICGLRY